MFKLNLLTPDKKLVYQQEIEEVLIPAFSGELNILPGHAPMVTTLATGIMRWRLKGSTEFQKVVISWGYCEVFPGGINILADAADLATDVVKEEAEEGLKKATLRLGSESLSDEQWDSVQRDVARFKSDLELIGQKAH